VLRVLCSSKPCCGSAPCRSSEAPGAPCYLPGHAIPQHMLWWYARGCCAQGAVMQPGCWGELASSQVLSLFSVLHVQLVAMRGARSSNRCGCQAQQWKHGAVPEWGLHRVLSLAFLGPCSQNLTDSGATDWGSSRAGDGAALCCS
jgi:hypothetical protein